MTSLSLGGNVAARSERRKDSWNLPPAGIAAVYFVLSVLWILLSDRVAASIFTDHETFVWVQTYKGWFFGAFTALLLYFLIKRAESVQAESELRFRTLVEQIPAITYVAIPHGGGTTYMSPQTELLLGYAPEEWNSTADMWHRLLHPADHDRVAQELDETYRTGKPFSTEYRMRSRDGRTFWFRDEATLVRDQAGEPVRLQGVMVDITERKTAEEALSHERDFSSTVLETTASLVAVLDREGRLVRFNRACERLSGYSAADANGRRPWDFLLPAEEVASARQQFESVRDGEAIEPFTNHLVSRTGEAHLVQWSVSPIRDAGGAVEYIVVTGADITEREANERQLQEQAALQARLLREVVTAQEAERRRLSMEIHDGPLQSLGVSLMALDRATKREERGEGEQALRELQSLRETLASTVSEVRSVLADLSLELLNQSGLVPALKDHADRFSEITGIAVSVDDNLGERLPGHLELMVYRLAQEALSNVRKHADATHVEIKIEAQDGRLIMSIADNGKGFDTSGIEQGSSQPGERLGLGSMRERVQDARGEFILHSSPNAGTRLTFVVPYKDV
ncbi:MAG TPA: PAS domain S-box protein [Chloroflexia bacterium]|jgi:PAS domain S-box-containing protein